MSSSSPREDHVNYSDGAHSDGLQQVVDGLAARLGRSVAVDDAQGDLVAVSRHFGDEDALRVYAVLQRVSDPRVVAHFHSYGIYGWTSPGRVPANPDLEFKARVCCPVRAHGILFAHLFLVDESVEEREVELAAGAADEIAQLMYRRLVLHEQEQGRRETLARDLVSVTATSRARARDRLQEEQVVITADPVCAVIVEIVGTTQLDESDTTLREVVERALRDRPASRALTTVRGRRAQLLLFGDAATVTSARALADRVVTDIGRGAGRVRAVAGLGTACSGVDAALTSHSEASFAAHAAALLPSLGEVVGQEDLGIYNFLLRLPRTELTEALCPKELRWLMAQDAGNNLVDTLEKYLDCSGAATRTATELRVHRSTLYYRLARIEALTGIDLQNGKQRLSLHIGTKLRHILAGDLQNPNDTGTHLS